MEELEEGIKKRGEGIQAQNSWVDVLCQPTYQEFPAQFITTVSQSSNQLLEPQREQDLSELLQVHPNNPSRNGVTLDTGETSLPPPPATPQFALLDSTITPPRTSVTPTLGHTPKVRADTQPGPRTQPKESYLWNLQRALQSLLPFLPRNRKDQEGPLGSQEGARLSVHHSRE